MKKLTGIILFIFVTSCSNFNQVPEPIKSDLERRLKDPSSFEYVESNRVKVSPFDVKRYLSLLDYHVIIKSEENPDLKNELDSIFDYDRDLGYKYTIRYRAKNGFGALGLSTQYYVVDNLGDIVYTGEKEISDKELYLKIGRKEVSRITGVSSKTN